LYTDFTIMSLIWICFISWVLPCLLLLFLSVSKSFSKQFYLFFQLLLHRS
jgi:hypothetical protein